MLWLRSQQEDSYFVNLAGTEFVLRLTHCIQQIVKLLLQTLDPHGIRLTIGLNKGHTHLQGLDPLGLVLLALL